MEPKELQEFIYFMTRNKGLTRRQLLRRDSLLARDFASINEERGLDEKPIISTPKVKLTHKDNTTRFHNPQGVISFLRLFSVDDRLKWYTHIWDKPGEPFSIKSMTDNVRLDYDKLCKFCFGDDNKGVPPQLFYHVWNFINTKDNSSIIRDQYGDQINTKWADVVEWCVANPGIWPGTYITKQGLTFESEINRFKRTIEFRTDVETNQKFGFQIKKLIKGAINGAVKVEFTENFESLGRDVIFYCNVKALYDGIAKLCSWVASYKTKGDTLVVDMVNDNDYYVLTLLHKGSSMSGPDNKIDGMSGDFKTIREILFSTCDFAISGKFNDSDVVVNALDKRTESIGGTIQTPTTKKTMTEKPEGVCYILKLYR